MKKNYLKAVISAFMLSFILNQTLKAQTWLPLGTGLQPDSVVSVYAMNIFNRNLYAAGYFPYAGSCDTANSIAEWNGVSWSALGSGFPADANFYGVYTLANYGGNLYAGGAFDSVGGIAAANIAQWNGSAWLPVDSGMPVTDSTFVNAFIVYNNSLIAGGCFTMAGTTPVQSVAQWNGSTWSAMGPGLPTSAEDYVTSFTVYRDTLYAGGVFIANTGSATNAYGLASWNGATWTLSAPMNWNIESGISGAVYSLCVYDGNLYVGGQFDSIAGIGAANIAQWNGSTWSTAGLGILPEDSGGLSALAVLNGNLYAGGYFRSAGGVADSGLALWNGAAWQSAGGSFYPYISALLVDNSNLFASGTFTEAAGEIGHNIAELSVPNGISEVPDNAVVSVFPNPNNGEFSISLKNATGKYIISIYNVIGDRIIQITLNTGKTGLDLYNAAKGVYFYRITSDEGDFFAAGELIVQ